MILLEIMGRSFKEFSISSNCCILNERNGICTLNDFTSISSKRLAVVDYCIVPYEYLDTFSDFEVMHSRVLMQERRCVPAFDPSNKVPDHSLVSWRIMSICKSCTNGCDEIVKEKELNQVFKMYSKEYTVNFMHSRGLLMRLMYVLYVWRTIAVIRMQWIMYV